MLSEVLQENHRLHAAGHGQGIDVVVDPAAGARRARTARRRPRARLPHLVLRGRDGRPQASIEPATVDEYLRTFSGREGVLGAMGVYRAAFTSIAQTEPLTRDKVKRAGRGARRLGERPRGQGGRYGEARRHPTSKRTRWPNSGHFMPEERPDAVIKHILAMAAKTR